MSVRRLIAAYHLALSLTAGLLFLAAVAQPTLLHAQPAQADTSKPLIEPIPRSARPSVMVSAFDFSAPLTESDQAELNSIGALAAALKGQNGPNQLQISGQNLGRAAADLMMARLLQTGNFRVLERKALDQVMAEQDLTASERAASNQDVASKQQILGARYLVTGSIIKFAKSKQKKGGLLGAVTKVAIGVAMESQQTAYEVGMTARIVETATGEVVASISSESVVVGDKSRLFGGVALGGGGAGGFGGTQTSGEREKRLVEALAMSVDALVVQLVEARRRGDMEPDSAQTQRK